MIRHWVCVSLLAAVAARADGTSPSVASINLCTDQLLLTVADPAQIASLSWLSADPAESMLAARAQRYPLNYGTAEEVLKADPDVVLGGDFTSAFTRQLLTGLGIPVVTIAPAHSIDEIERNLRIVASAIGRESKVERVIAAMRARVERIAAAPRAGTLRALVVRPGGFTVGAGSLADELMRLAGLTNVAAEDGLDSWGSLSLESLLTSRADMLIFTGYRREEASLANSIYDHPVLRLRSAVPRTTSIDATFWACGIPESLKSAELLAAAAAGTNR